MDTLFTELFIRRWKKYFADAELPICYFYTDQVREEDMRETTHEHRCLIGNLSRVRDGFSFVYDAKTPGCAGGKRYSGFSQRLRPKFEYFLSCGIPGEMEGERYKKSPKLVKEQLEQHPPFEAPGKYLVFKRWDKLAKDDQPLAAIFFATPDVLSGLFTLANYDMADVYGVITPMGSGCASIINYPYVEASSEKPRCVLGMFDVSARPCVPENKLTFTVPMKRFEQMVLNMDESFLVTESWNLVRNRLSAAYHYQSMCRLLTMSDAFLGPYQFYSVLDFTAAGLHSPLAGRRELWSAAHHNCVVMLLQIFCKPVALQLWYDPYSKQGLTPTQNQRVL